ncbi:SMC-Scp complex subunit ScpB [Oceanibaculum pacificum]|uniref:Segregation and condensation protein B n=1 Tax=Oceanibaculum pacificum TaxID=580166 RepID=A0A154VBS4_9PROT|nr:SMC-Scp complex subunit ScpB [Oceanibaculum pacificum]KZC98838.1 segregation and condensation protein B [Oceanibaculum pacificum]
MSAERDRAQALRLLEAMLFAAAEPVAEAQLAERLPDGMDIKELLTDLAGLYENRGVVLTRIAGSWTFRTAPDLAPMLAQEREQVRKLSRAAIETLAIIAYHQPITRAEVEEVRGVGLSKGTLDVLLEAGWVKPGRRRESPGRPLTWVTTDVFLSHFGLADLKELPGVEELKAAGLLDKRPSLATIAMREEEADMASGSADEEEGDEPLLLDEEDL